MQICLDCTTAYSVGAAKCPHCGSQRWTEEGTEMAKISRHGGPSLLGTAETSTAAAEDAPAAAAEAVVPEPVLPESVEVTELADAPVVEEAPAPTRRTRASGSQS